MQQGGEYEDVQAPAWGGQIYAQLERKVHRVPLFSFCRPAEFSKTINFFFLTIYVVVQTFWMENLNIFMITSCSPYLMIFK